MGFLHNIERWFRSIFPKETTFDKNKLVYTTTQLYLAEIIKLKLEGEGIPVIMINKRDTAYNTFGEIELYVNRDDVIRAKYLIATPNDKVDE